MCTKVFLYTLIGTVCPRRFDPFLNITFVGEWLSENKWLSERQTISDRSYASKNDKVGYQSSWKMHTVDYQLHLILKRFRLYLSVL